MGEKNEQKLAGVKAKPDLKPDLKLGSKFDRKPNSKQDPKPDLKPEPKPDEERLLKAYKAESRGFSMAGKVIVLFLAMGFFILLSRYPRQAAEYKRLQEVNKSLKTELKRLSREEEDLKELAKLAGSGDFTEQIAREELGLVKPDEIIFID